MFPASIISLNDEINTMLFDHPFSHTIAMAMLLICAFFSYKIGFIDKILYVSMKFQLSIRWKNLLKTICELAKCWFMTSAKVYDTCWQ